MTPAQTADLLSMCAAFDRRTVGRADVTAWQLALHDVDHADAQQAVIDHYRDNRQWIMPSDIRTLVRRTRDRRIEAAHALYDGNPGETGAQSAQSIRNLVDDAASGRLPAQPIRLALEPGDTIAAPGARMRAMLDAAIHTAPSPRDGVVNVRSVPCARCNAQAGQSCRTRRGKPRSNAHPSRLDDARRAAAGIPPRDQADIDAEIQQRRDASAAAGRDSSQPEDQS